jgi:hypothetical protein
MEGYPMKWINPLVIIAFFTGILPVMQGCAREIAPLKTDSGLPQSKLAHYNDTFDSMRSDLWTKAAIVFTEGQLSKFKLADMSVDNGSLKIETKKGCFSKGAFAFKYALRGDFDIQVDCHIDFLGGFLDMDQIAAFVAHEKGLDFKKGNSTVVQAVKKSKWYRGRVCSLQRKSGEFHLGWWYEADGFHGTLRIIRKGNKATTLCRIQGKSKWKKLQAFRFTKNDVLVGFLLQNFTPERTTITAESPITVQFDNFIINAAQAIVEEEI